MATIIDTYNCVYAGVGMGGAVADLGVRTLCRWIVAAARREKTTLVLDGRPKPDEPSENEFPELNLVYSGTGIKADQVIEQMAQRNGRRTALTVVTNDRALGAAVRRLGAKVVSCETYLQGLTGPRKSQRSGRTGTRQKSAGTGSSGETDAWMAEFGITDVPLAKPPRAAAASPDDLDIEDLLGPRG
jgi:hypothetical protein